MNGSGFSLTQEGMKMKAKKGLAAVMALVMLAGMVPAFSPALAPKALAYSEYTKTYDTEYSYPSGTEFIYQLGLYYSSSSDADAEQHLIDAGFTPFGVDFNEGAGGKYVHGGYKTTSDPAQAVKAIRIWHGANDPTETTGFIGGGVCAFYQVGSGAHTVTPNVLDGMVNLNKGNGGDNLELFATPDHAAGPALTALSMVHNDDAAIAQEVLLNFGYTIATSFQNITAPHDLNAGAGSDALRAAYHAAAAYTVRTAEYGNALRNALNAAEAILADLSDGYTTSTQAQIDAAADALTAALPAHVHVYADYPAPGGAEYAYAAGTQFVSQIAVTCSASGTETATQDLQRMGFTPFGQSFNAGTGGDYIRGGYKTTTDPAQAVRALRVWKGGNDPDVTSVQVDGTTVFYYQVGAGASAQTPDTFGKLSLNYGNNGSNLRLFVSADPAAGLPVTELAMNRLINPLSQYGYSIADSFQSPGTNQDLNAGAGGDYNYLAWRTIGLTAVDSSALRTAYAASKQLYEGGDRFWYNSALDDAAAILDDLRDGFTTFTQAQIDAAAAALDELPEFYSVSFFLNDTDSPHLHFLVEGAPCEVFDTRNDPIRMTFDQAAPYEFYYDADGCICFYVPADSMPDFIKADPYYTFGKWLQTNNSACPQALRLTQTFTFLTASEKEVPPTTQPPQVPEAITINYGDTQTAFEFRVNDLAGMEKNLESVYVYTNNCNFLAELQDGLLRNETDDAVIPFTVSSDGAFPVRNAASCSFTVAESTPAPYICHGFIHIDAAAFDNAQPGEYTGTLDYLWRDTENSGSGTVSLTLTVPDPSAEQLAQVAAVIDLIDAIGPVAYSKACKANISAARSAYDALTDYLKTLVTNYDTLTAAESVYLANMDNCHVGAHSLTLDGRIGVNFYVYVPLAGDDVHAVFRVDGRYVQDVPIDLDDYITLNEDQLYKFTCRVAPAQIESDIECAILIGDAPKPVEYYSVMAYFNEIQNTPSLIENEGLVALAATLANYGYWANKYFGYRPSYMSAPFEYYEYYINPNVVYINYINMVDSELTVNPLNMVEYYGSSLVLRSGTAARHYFTLKEGWSIDDLTFAMERNGKRIPLTAQESGEYYFVEVPDIPAALLCDCYRIIVSVSGEDFEMIQNFSPLMYAHQLISRLKETDSDYNNLVQLLTALFPYYDAAINYFPQQDE